MSRLTNLQASTSTAHLHSTPTGIRLRHEQHDEGGSPGPYLARPKADSKGKEKAGEGKGKGKERARNDGFSRLRIGSRGWVKEGFRIFGEHCARNQIRTLLIDCLVMTNLFYPALSIYLQKRFPPLHPPAPPSHNTHRIHSHDHAGPSRRIRKEHPLSLLSTPVLDSFFPYPPPLLPRLTWTGWWGRDTGQVDDWIATHLIESEDGVGYGDEEIRILRIGWADVGDVLDRETSEDEKEWQERDHVLLRLVRDTAEGWDSSSLGQSGEGCVRQLRSTTGNEVIPEGPCYLLTPGRGPINSLTPISSVSSTESDEEEEPSPVNWVPDAGKMYHSVATVFRIPRNSSSSFDSRWEQALEEVAKQVEGELFEEATKPRLTAAEQTEHWLLSHSPPDSINTHSDSHSTEDTSSTPKSVLGLYLLLFTILGAQLSAATKVHSRFGLAFTGIVQLCCSAVMSFSVLALLGWNGWGWDSGHQKSLPTYVLPFVIVVVGAENMSTLTKAVFSIPFTYSVPVRIGLGLRKVGTTIALTSLTDLALLGVIWLFINLRPVREFCLFAAVVIITDWFMLHTFFLTVLSIDAQRLELADVLASPSSAATTEPPRPRDDGESKPQRFSWRNILRARTTKSSSLLLILISIGVIYYLTERHRLPLSTPSLYGYNPTTQPTAVPIPFRTLLSDLSSLSLSDKFWRSLNPLGLSSLRVIIPPASIIVLPRLGHHMRPADIHNLSLPTSRIVLPRLKPLFYLFKVVILPQAVTAGALYALLLYLLKDADLLDAQRNRLGRGEEVRTSDDEDGLPRKRALRGVDIHLLPCSHEADVDLVASSDDGLIVFSAGIDNALCLWRFGSGAGAHHSSGTRETLKTDLGRDCPLCAITVSPDGKVLGAATVDGTVQIWDLQEEGSPSSRPLLRVDSGSSSITNVRFVERRHSDDPFIARPSSPSSIPVYDILLAQSDGTVTLISHEERKVIVSEGGRIVFPDEQNTEVAILSVSGDLVTLYLPSGTSWSPVIISATSPCRITAATITQDMIALGHRSGLVEVFDLNGNPIVAIGGIAQSPLSSHPPSLEGIKRLALSQPSSSKCTSCGTITTECVFVVSSTAERVYVDRINTRGNTIACRCTRRPSSAVDEKGALASGSSPGRLVIPPTASRAGMSPGPSPKKSPSLLPPVSNGEFPLSSHGTRRLSALHRDDGPNGNANNGLSMTPSTSTHPHTPSEEVDVSPLGAIVAPGGGECWHVHGGLVTGLRRVGGGIDDAQWEVWSIDLKSPWNGHSLIVDAAPLTSLISPAPVSAVNTGVRAQRAERLLSLSGRAPFPSLGNSFSVPTYAPLAYVEIRPFHRISAGGVAHNAGVGSKGGKGGIIMGMGNRLAIISIPLERPSRHNLNTGAGALRTRRSTGLGQGGGVGVGLGLTPPPPSVRRDTAEKIELSKKIT